MAPLAVPIWYDFVFTMRPERWRTVRYGKQPAAPEA
jgi:hypothetical protein